MKKALTILILVFLISSPSLYATIYPCTTANVEGLKLLMNAIDNLNSIPDVFFSNLPANAYNYTGTLNYGTPFDGDWVSDTPAPAGSEYERIFIQKDSTGQLVLSANYTTNPSKGIIYFAKPEYCRAKVNAPIAGIMNNSTTMKLYWDNSNPGYREFKVLISGMATANVPLYQWLSITKNITDSSYKISSTMIFDHPFTYVDTANYNSGTVLLYAEVKQPDNRTAIYTDRANTDTDKIIEISTLPSTGDGPWPTPFYIDENNPSPNVPQPSGWGFSELNQSQLNVIDMRSHNDVINGIL